MTQQTGRLRKVAMLFNRSQLRRSLVGYCRMALARLPLLLLASITIGCGEDSVQQVPVQQLQERKVGFAPKKKVKIVVPQGLNLTGVDPATIFEVAEFAPANYVVEQLVPAGKPDDYFDVADAGTPKTDHFEAPIPAAGSITARLPNGFQIVEGTKSIDGWPQRIVCKYDQTEMTLIPRGRSVLGSNTGPKNCTPEVNIFLDAFYMSTREITLAQFAMYRRHAAGRNEKVEDAINFQSPADHPALGVSWRDARAYARSSGRDLPTEAQWEFAARGPAGYTSPWGNSRPLWRTPRKPGQIDAIGHHPDDSSIFGVGDLAGNAREWVLDFYRDDSFLELSKLSDEKKRNWGGPRSASVAAQRVVKGSNKNWTVLHREGQRMTDRVKDVGFRCVVNLTADR